MRTTSETGRRVCRDRHSACASYITRRASGFFPTFIGSNHNRAMKIFLLTFLLGLFSLTIWAQAPACVPPWQVHVSAKSSLVCEGSSAGADAIFTTSLSSASNYWAVWYKSGTEPKSSDYVALFSNGAIPTFHLENIKREDSGYYVLRVEYGKEGNPACYKEDSAKIRVVKNPEAMIFRPVANGGAYHTSFDIVGLQAPPPKTGEQGVWSLSGGNATFLSRADSSISRVQLSTFNSSALVRWTVTSEASICPPAVAELTILRVPLTVANAGPDQTIPLSEALQRLVTLQGNTPFTWETVSWKGLSPSYAVDGNQSVLNVFFSKAGRYPFVYTISNPEANASSSDTIYITIAEPLAIEEGNSDLSKAQVFYEKSQESIVLRSFPVGEGRILNMHGTLLKEFTTSSDELRLRVDALPKGIYLLQVQGNEGQKLIRKILID